MWRRLGIVAAVAAVGSIAAANNVSRAVPPAERQAARALMAGAERGDGFDAQVAFILEVQERVLAAAPIDREIPVGQTRELTDVLDAGHGLCFDRSRAIETVLRAHGFEARHVAIFSTEETGSALKSLLSRGVRSHALTEVRTDRGWLLVDPNQRWIGLTEDGRLARLDDLAGKTYRTELPDILSRPFTAVRGLHSRHGGFYPPYVPVPDISWPELVGA